MVALPIMEVLCHPARLDQIKAWMEAVNLGVANPASGLDLSGLTMLIADTSGDLPAGCWTPQTRREFARRPDEGARFLPAVADVDHFLRPKGRELLRTRDRLRALRDEMLMVNDAAKVEAEAEDAQRGRNLSQEQRGAISARLQANLAAMADGKPKPPPGHAAPDDPPAPTERVRPHHLRGEALWLSRVARAERCGLPPPPRPASFEGYGK